MMDIPHSSRFSFTLTVLRLEILAHLLDISFKRTSLLRDLLGFLKGTIVTPLRPRLFYKNCNLSFRCKVDNFLSHLPEFINFMISLQSSSRSGHALDLMLLELNFQVVKTPKLNMKRFSKFVTIKFSDCIM